MNRLRWLAAGALVPAIGMLAVTVRAQFAAPKFLKVSPTAPKSVKAGKSFTLTVAVTIDGRYHIQANPAKEGYIATEMEVGPVKGFKVDKIVYPKSKETVISGEKLPVYEGKLNIKADIVADKGTKPGRYSLPITLKYQGCDDQKCFPPSTVTAKATISVTHGARSK